LSPVAHWVDDESIGTGCTGVDEKKLRGAWLLAEACLLDEAWPALGLKT